MERFEATRILQALVDGVNPHTGESLPKEDFYHHPETLRALFMAVRALEAVERKEEQRSQLPKAGEPWGKQEDMELIREFEEGLSIKELAQKHGRTVGAITSRLKRWGKLI